MVIPEWLAQAITGAILALGGSIIAGFIWLIRLGSRVSALEKNEMSAHKQLIALAKESGDTVAALTEKLASSREEALKTFATNDDFQRLEDKVDEVRIALAALAPTPPKRSRQVRRRASSASEE